MLHDVMDTLAILAIPLLGMNALLCIVGIFRHIPSAITYQHKLDDLYRRGINGAVRYAARMQVRGEQVRTAIKAILLPINLVLLTQVWANILIAQESDIPRLSGVRDFLVALLMLSLLLLLTWWSEWERHQEPDHVSPETSHGEDAGHEPTLAG